MKENGVSSALRKGLKKNFPGIFWQRVENKIKCGTPDIDLCYKGVCAKIETKNFKYYSKNLSHFQPLQQLYAKLYSEAGGRWFLFVRIRDSFYLLKDVPLNFLEEHLSTIAVYQAHDKKIDYHALGSTIFGLTV